MENYGSQISTDSLLLARGIGPGFGGFGYGYGGGFANPSANAIRLDRNADQVASEGACTREIIGKGQDYNLHAFDAAQESIQFGRVCDRLSDAEFRTGDRLRDIEREMAANAREAAKCCCDVKVQSANDKAEILAAIADSKATTLAVESRGVERMLNATQAELTALKTQVACGCGCHGHHGRG